MKKIDNKHVICNEVTSDPLYLQKRAELVAKVATLPLVHAREFVFPYESTVIWDCFSYSDFLNSQAYHRVVHKFGYNSPEIKIHVPTHLSPQDLVQYLEEIVAWIKGSPEIHFSESDPLTSREVVHADSDELALVTLDEARKIIIASKTKRDEFSK
jgi:hypothetical protein